MGDDVWTGGGTTRRAPSALPGLVLLLLLVFVRPAGAEDDTRQTWIAQREATPARIEEHARWCSAQKLRAARNTAYERLLQLLPDHAAARKALRYRNEDGTWVRERYRIPKPTDDAEKEAAAAARLHEAILPLRTAVLALVDDEDVAREDVERALDELALLLPDDVDIHQQNGEVRLNGTWVLSQTARAVSAGLELRLGVQSVVAREPAPERAQRRADEIPFLPDFAEGAESPRVRLLSMRGGVPARRTTQLTAASWTAWQHVFGRRTNLVRHLRIFVYPDPATGIRALRLHPGIEDSDVEEAARLNSYWARSSGASDSDLFVWSREESHRIETCVRQALQRHFQRAHRLTGKHGWAWEGFGHWFMGVMLGTHHTVYVRKSDYATPTTSDDRARRLRDGSADWLELGADLARSKDWPDLRIALGRDVNTLTSDDLLASYLLARFLVEGHGEDLNPLLEDVGSGMQADAWITKHLGWSLSHLERRLRRWALEVHERRP